MKLRISIWIMIPIMHILHVDCLHDLRPDISVHFSPFQIIVVSSHVLAHTHTHTLKHVLSLSLSLTLSQTRTQTVRSHLHAHNHSLLSHSNRQFNTHKRPPVYYTLRRSSVRDSSKCNEAAVTSQNTRVAFASSNRHRANCSV
jgi:hypothetical protein